MCTQKVHESQTLNVPSAANELIKKERKEDPTI